MQKCVISVDQYFNKSVTVSLFRNFYACNSMLSIMVWLTQSCWLGGRQPKSIASDTLLQSSKDCGVEFPQWGSLGLIFLEVGDRIIVCFECNVALLYHVLQLKLEALGVDSSRKWFQQYSTTSHMAYASIAIVRELFFLTLLDDFTFRRSPDLTGCNFFL